MDSITSKRCRRCFAFRIRRLSSSVMAGFPGKKRHRNIHASCVLWRLTTLVAIGPFVKAQFRMISFQ